MKEIRKIHGPYASGKQNRKRVLLYFKDGSRTTKSWARYLYEREHGEIDPSLTVDNIDEDCSNDSLDNLQLLTRSENSKKSAANGKNGIRKKYTGTCPNCGAYFTRYLNRVRHNRKQGKAGPFCGKSCAGVYSMDVKMGRLQKLSVIDL